MSNSLSCSTISFLAPETNIAWVRSTVLTSSINVSRKKILLYSWLNRCASVVACGKYIRTSHRVRSVANGQKVCVKYDPGDTYTRQLGNRTGPSTAERGS